MFKILQPILQQSVNRELPDVPAGFRKDRGTRDQIANIHRIIEKIREFQKNIYFCFIDYAKAFDCVDHNKLWKILTLHTSNSMFWASLVMLLVKNLSAKAGDIRDASSIPGLGRSPGEGKRYPLRYSGLENSMDCIVHEVAKSD